MDDPKAASQRPLPLPRLPVRASIYIAPDGTVHFGALFAELLPVARALGAVALDEAPSTEAAPIAEGAAEAGGSETEKRETAATGREG